MLVRLQGRSTSFCRPRHRQLTSSRIDPTKTDLRQHPTTSDYFDPEFSDSCQKRTKFWDPTRRRSPKEMTSRRRANPIETKRAGSPNVPEAPGFVDIERIMDEYDRMLDNFIETLAQIQTTVDKVLERVSKLVEVRALTSEETEKPLHSKRHENCGNIRVKPGPKRRNAILETFTPRSAGLRIDKSLETAELPQRRRNPKSPGKTRTGGAVNDSMNSTRMTTKTGEVTRKQRTDVNERSEETKSKSGRDIKQGVEGSRKRSKPNSERSQPQGAAESRDEEDDGARCWT